MIDLEGEFTFRADGAELVALDPDLDSYTPTGETEDLGQVTARCIERRLTKHGMLRTWEVLGGGKVRFQTLGLPADLRKAEPK